ncbi:hypothetical protein E7V67_001480 [[Empedobacter] haloabium]|uniref:Lipoprotein n=1 Tax=[Empedobacter] haloabium TaxID=592317 RepID=A0ABZ1UMM4_9BURK
MRFTLGSVALCLLAGCSLNPPKPPQCEGEFRPVNAQPGQAALPMNTADSLALCMKGAGHGHQS